MTVCLEIARSRVFVKRISQATITDIETSFPSRARSPRRRSGLHASPFDPSMDSGPRAVSRDRFTVLSRVEGREMSDEDRDSKSALAVEAFMNHAG
jgi:hypothetical protein